MKTSAVIALGLLASVQGLTTQPKSLFSRFTDAKTQVAPAPKGKKNVAPAPVQGLTTQPKSLFSSFTAAKTQVAPAPKGKTKVAPAPKGRSTGTQMPEPFFSKVLGLDRFATKAPVPEPELKESLFGKGLGIDLFKSAKKQKDMKIVVVPDAKKQGDTLFDKVLGMDLFFPVKTQNDYGARDKKILSVGKITSGKSYIPAGLSAAEYTNVRSNAANKKAANYAKNVKKAGIFEDYTEFYIKRGTDGKQDWKNSATLGHRMAKTKYDWTGLSDKPLYVSEAKKRK